MLREYFYWIYIKARSQIISLKTALHSLLTFWIWLNLKFFVAFCSLCMLPIFSFLFLSGTFLNHRFWTFGFAFKCVIWLDPKLICFKSLLGSCRVDFEILIEYRARANQKYFLSFLCRNQCRKGQIVFFTQPLKFLSCTMTPCLLCNNRKLLRKMSFLHFLRRRGQYL